MPRWGEESAWKNRRLKHNSNMEQPILDTQALEIALRQRLVRLYQEVADATDGQYKPMRLRKMVSEMTGVETASRLILSEAGTSGFWELVQRNFHELTVEYIVVTGPWSQIMAAEVLDAARVRLRDVAGINI